MTLFIIDDYISSLLLKTLIDAEAPVLENEFIQNSSFRDILTAYNEKEAIKHLNKTKSNIYTNSEKSYKWIKDNSPDKELVEKLILFKDKTEFRHLLKDLYPDFFFWEVSISELDNIDTEKIKFPIVLKPSIGFFSKGVYIIRNKDEWENIKEKIFNEVESVETNSDKSVLDNERFILEEYIEGEEFAIDVYFDENANAHIFNILKHLFKDNDDVSDRLYYTSKDIIIDNFKKIKEFLNKLSEIININKFPMHIELRIKNEKIIPIEINPLRFAGLCCNDIAYYAFGINQYEYLIKNKAPNWENILHFKDNSLYYFYIAESLDIATENKPIFNHIKFKENFGHILEYRIFDYSKLSAFSYLIAKCSDMSEIEKNLNLEIKDYIETTKIKNSAKKEQT